MEFKLITASDAQPISEFYIKNSDCLRKWEPLREDDYHSAESWRERLKAREKEQVEGRSAYFTSYNSSGDITAICNLTNIVKGPFQACNIGYAVSESYQGKGVMSELCNHAVNFAFSELNLNRIMANYMPTNSRSEALLMRLGFIKEGVAKKYLKINGQWEDHVLTSLLNPRNM